MAGRAQRAGLAVEELHAVARTALGGTPERAVSAVNAYAAARGVTFRARRADLDALDALGKETRIDPAWYGEQLGRQIELARHATWERLRESWAPGGDVVVFKDLTPRYADARPDWVEDYVDYTGHPTKYVLRVKHHDADCLTLSTYRREGDSQVVQPLRVLRPAGDLRQLRHPHGLDADAQGVDRRPARSASRVRSHPRDHHARLVPRT